MTNDNFNPGNVAPKSPWRVNVCGWIAETCSSDERILRIRESTNHSWLKRVIEWPDTQSTVIEAARRRLRVLSKKPVRRARR